MENPNNQDVQLLRSCYRWRDGSKRLFRTNQQNFTFMLSLALAAQVETGNAALGLLR
jgi:hypothetical protein